MTYHNHTDATDRKTMSVIRFEDAANRMLNSAVMPVLNSPLVPLIWPFIATITYTGRRPGKQQGPCLDAIWQHHTVRADDYTTETRWPDFVAALREGTDVTSSLSIQLYTNKFELGALNHYSESTGICTPHIEEFALAMAAHAAIRLSSTCRSDQFRSALASRDIIGQAKGIIMERYNLRAVAAFKLLIKLSQERNTLLPR